MAKEILADEKVKVLSAEEFEEIHWRSVYAANNAVPRMFQIWACKQVLGIAGTNEMLARYTPNQDKLCPSCQQCAETCGYILACKEAGRVQLLHQSIDLVGEWMADHCTDVKLRNYLLQ